MTNTKNQENGRGKEEEQKWFAREDFQDLAKMGGDFLKKTVASGIDVIKEVKENLPKDASLLLTKGKEELLKSLTQDMAKNIVSYSVEKIFSIARQHRLEFSLRLRKNQEEEERAKNTTSFTTTRSKKR